MGLQTVRHNLATKNNRNSSGISKTSFITQRLSHFLTLASLYCSLQKCSSITLKQAQKCLESLRNLNLVHLKLRQHYKSTILPLKKKSVNPSWYDTIYHTNWGPSKTGRDHYARTADINRPVPSWKSRTDGYPFLNVVTGTFDAVWSH